MDATEKAELEDRKKSAIYRIHHGKYAMREKEKEKFIARVESINTWEEMADMGTELASRVKCSIV